GGRGSRSACASGGGGDSGRGSSGLFRPRLSALQPGDRLCRSSFPPLEAGPMGPASKNIALYVTTCVSPHDGHITSIGRLLVVISTGFPQRRHAIDIGADAGAWTGPGPGGGRAALGPKRLPPPVRRHSPRTATSSRRNRRPRTTA